MLKLKNSFIAFFGLLTLIGTIAILTPTITRSQVGGVATKDVNVVNTPTVNVGNTPTVNAQQSGAWNVGITGTPTVNLANNSVQVSNPATNPVPVRDVDEEARQPFQELRLVEFGETDNNADTLFNPIPPGKRLVIEHVSAIASLPPGQKMVCGISVKVN